MNKNILIVGKGGYLATRLKNELNCRVSGKMIYSLTDAISIVKRYKPKVIINAIGYTGTNNVDGCELDPNNTMIANTFVPLLLAEACLRNNIKLVHISSGCIYNYDYSKNKPITEDDIPDYYDLYYSRSKVYAETALDFLSQKYNILITRIRIPLDDKPHPKNIIDKLLKYKKVLDIPNSVTYIPDFVKALKHLLKINAKGIYNIAAKEPLRYPDLMNVYKKYVPKFNFEIISPKSLKMNRTNLVLSTKKLEKTGFKVRKTKAIIEECVRNYVKN